MSKRASVEGQAALLARARRRRNLTGYLFLGPSLIALLTFLVLPIFLVIWLSFHEWNLLGPVRFVGLQNYEWMFTNPTLAKSLAVTALFVLLVIPVQTALGLMMALLIQRGLPGTGAFQVLLVIPWVSAPIALGMVWRWILSYSDGILNSIIGQKVPWLTDPTLALPAVATVAVWQGVGYVALFFFCRAAKHSAQRLRRGAARRRRPPQTALVNHAAAASPHNVLCARNRHHLKLPGLRYRLRAHPRRRAARIHRCDCRAHLLRGLRFVLCRESQRYGARAAGDPRAHHGCAAAVLRAEDNL